MLDKLRKQTFKHQGKYLSIKIWLPILEKTYFYTEKNSDGAKKDLSCDEKSIMRSSHEFPRDRMLKLVFKTFLLYSNLLRKKISLLREKTNRQINDKSFCRKRSLVFVRIQNILQSKQNESRNLWDHTSAMIKTKIFENILTLWAYTYLYNSLFSPVWSNDNLH